ncbi:MAG: diguanylate cyclase [Candidatus Delongbacteria bacterium]|nr:diguanylate cyclase [Candidatus Delongbacteria bacterium]
MYPLILIHALFLFLSALSVLFLSVFCWKKRNTAGISAWYLALSMVGAAIYNFGYAMEILNSSMTDIMFWVRFQHWGIQIIPPFWLLFSLSITGKAKLITPFRIFLLFVLPAFLLFSAQTLGSFNWWHHNPRLLYSKHLTTFMYDRTWIVYLGVCYQSLCLVISTLLYIWMYFQSSSIIRRQMAVYWIGSIIPWISSLSYNLGLNPYNFDTSPLALSLSLYFFSVGFFKVGILDIVPLARDLIFENIKDGILVLDYNNRIIDFNPQMSRIIPRLNRGLIGISINRVLIDHPELIRMIRDNLTQPYELQINQDGTPLFYQAVYTPLYRRKRFLGKIITFHDYTQIKHLHHQLEKQATLDGLTGLYNHWYFNKIADHEIQRAWRYNSDLSLILIDIDYFKQINDHYGHWFGDSVLKAVADVFRSKIRQSDSVGRLGGDEFSILLPEIGIEGACATAEKLRHALADLKILNNNQPVSITGSFGVAGINPARSFSLEELLKKADHALYKAKEAGRNKVCLDNDQTTMVTD